MVQSSEIKTGHDNYCQDKAAPDGSSFYYATLFEPVADRPLLYALFALHREISGCLVTSPDPGVNRMKLHWWFEELERLFQMQPRHPVTTALLPLVNDNRLQQTSVHHYLKTIETIASTQPPPGFEDWLKHFSTGLGQIWECSITISSTASGNPTLPGHNGGMIFIFELLQDIRPLTARGYNLLPEELLEKYNLSVLDLNDSANQDNTTAMLDALLERIVTELGGSYRELRTGSSGTVPLYHLIMNRITRALCEETRKDGARLFQHRVGLTPLRKFWIACWTKFKARAAIQP